MYYHTLVFRSKVLYFLSPKYLHTNELTYISTSVFRSKVLWFLTPKKQTGAIGFSMQAN